MNMIACRACGAQVAETAGTCPNCGVITPNAKRNASDASAIKGCLIVTIVGLLVLTILWSKACGAVLYGS